MPTWETLCRVAAATALPVSDVAARLSTSPLLILLAITAAASCFVGERGTARFTYAGTNGPGQQGRPVHAAGTSASSPQRGLRARLGPYR
jgi:hypothetical protein